MRTPIHSIEEANKIAGMRGGQCISMEYKNCDAPLYWKCKLGHVWKAAFADIKRGSWCAQCAGLVKYTIEQMQEFAVLKQGKCLSKTYVSGKVPLLWECKNGHKWQAAPSDIITKGYWCAKCSRVELRNNIKNTEFRNNKLNEAKVIAKIRGGECLSVVYINAHSNLKFECRAKHKWEARLNSIKSGQWCPFCNSNIQESIIRSVLEYLLDDQVVKYRPANMLSDKGFRLEFDFWNTKWNLAGEHQGAQHFRCGNYIRTNEQLQERKKYDELKKDYCKNNGIIFFETTDLYDLGISLIDIASITNYTRKTLTSVGIEPLKAGTPIIDFSCIYRAAKQLESIQSIAQSREGDCKSKTYYGNRVKLDFICAQNHTWKARPADIKRGTWCPTCAINRRKNLNRKKKT